MIEGKNSDLKSILLTLAGYNKEGKMVQGLLTEKVKLSLKRRLQKIHTEAGKAWTEFQKDVKEITDSKEPDEVKTKEMNDLLNEPFKLNVEKASMEMIEEIVTENFYDTETLEQIAE
jgi:hypothetical protein